MFGQDDSITIGIGISIGVAVLFAVIFTLALLCGLLSITTGMLGAPEASLLLPGV
jgi:hypothetical protein